MNSLSGKLTSNNVSVNAKKFAVYAASKEVLKYNI